MICAAVAGLSVSVGYFLEVNSFRKLFRFHGEIRLANMNLTNLLAGSGIALVIMSEYSPTRPVHCSDIPRIVCYFSQRESLFSSLYPYGRSGFL
jgi:hypothetical protein